MKRLLLLIILAPAIAHGQAASQFRQTTFANLGVPQSNSTRYCVDCQATSPCTGGGTGAYAYRVDGVWNCNKGTPGSGGGGGGTVTSVAMTVPNPFTIGGTPITSLGTLALSWATGQTANRFLATPNGTTGAVSLRAITAADILLQGVSNSRCLRTDSSGNIVVAAGDCATGGTVNSVGLSLPNIFSVSGSPVTTTGTLTATLANQNANLVFAGPSAAPAATPTFRSLVAGDIPSLDAAKITSGTMATARLGSGSASSSTCLKGDSTWGACGTGTPAGSNTQFQFNNSGVFGGSSNFFYTSASGQVTLNQSANGNNALYGKRATDTGQAGNLVLFQNQAGTVDLFKLDVNGAVTLNSATGVQDVLTVQKAIQLTTGTRPTCDSTTRGTFWYVAGGAGIADSVAVCAKSSSDVFSWVSVATIP